MLLEPFVPKPDSKYAWSSGVVRSLEKKLLKKIDYQKLIDLDENEIGQFLTEFGYQGKSSTDNDFDHQSAALLKFIDKHAENKELITGFKLRWDFKNAAFIQKKRLLGMEFLPEDILPWGNFSYDDYLKSVESGKSNFPEFMVKAMEKAHIDYDTEKEIWRVGMILDAAYYRDFIKRIPDNNKFLNQYYSILIDELNIITALRFIEMGYVSKDYEEFYVDYGFIPYNFIDSLWETDRAGIAGKFGHTFYGKPLQDAIARSLADEDMLFVANQFLSFRNQYLKESIYSAFGLEVLIAYFEKKRIEIDTLRTILRVKSSNLEKEAIERTVEYAIV